MVRSLGETKSAAIYLIVQTTTNSSLGATLLVEESNDIGLGTAAAVFLGLLVGLGEELDGRETSDSVFLGNVRVLLVVGLDVGNDTLNRTLEPSEEKEGEEHTSDSTAKVLATGVH